MSIAGTQSIENLTAAVDALEWAEMEMHDAVCTYNERLADLAKRLMEFDPPEDVPGYEPEELRERWAELCIEASSSSVAAVEITFDPQDCRDLIEDAAGELPAHAEMEEDAP